MAIAVTAQGGAAGRLDRPVLSGEAGCPAVLGVAVRLSVATGEGQMVPTGIPRDHMVPIMAL